MANPGDLARRRPSRREARRAETAPAAPLGVSVRSRIEYQRAVRGGRMHPDERLLAYTLATYADENGAIPNGYQPSLVQLGLATDLSVGRIRSCLDSMERAGWITRPHRDVGHTIPTPVTLTRPLPASRLADRDRPHPGSREPR